MGKLSSAKRIGNGLVYAKGAAHEAPARRGSHHQRIRRRAYPTPGSLATLREGTEYGTRGTKQRAPQEKKKK